jgi:hypothetical protein
MPKTARIIYSNPLHQRNDTTADSMLVLDKEHQWSPDYAVALHRTNERWIRAEATFHCTIKEWTAWRMTQFAVSAWKGKERERETVIRVHRFLDNGMVKRLFVDMRLPHNTEADSIKVHFWNADGDKKILIENLKVWAF